MKYTYIEALNLSFPEVSWKLINPSAPEEESFSLAEMIYPDCFKLISGTLPSKSDLDAEVARLQAVYDAQDYARSREAEYPTIQECVHAILDDDLTALQVLRQAVKDKYPKP